ncbi:MAG: hypothetical protein ABIP94_05300 [Planctomycetota bacterium]
MRWHGLALGVVMIATVPLVHFVWHIVLRHEKPAIQTRSQVPAPEPPLESDTLLDGSWMKKQQLYLREASPIVWWLRSNWNELRYRIGAPQSDQVHFGRDEWFFLAGSVTPDVAMFTEATPRRRQFLREIRDRVRAAGAEFCMVIMPDKARVYADKAFADGVISPAKAPIYQMLQDDLAAVDIPTVDINAAMAAARAAMPDEDLYFRRDTHWRAPGALVSGRVVAAMLEQRYGHLLSPRKQIELGNLTSIRLVGDLTALFGIGTVEMPDDLLGMRTVPMSLLTEHLAEQRDYYGINLREDGRSIPLYGKDSDAEVLVIGMSFTEENGLNALSLSLGRPVRGIIVRGAPGLDPLRIAMQEIERGTRAKVVIWEMVERGFFEEAWRAPHL